MPIVLGDDKRRADEHDGEVSLIAPGQPLLEGGSEQGGHHWAQGAQDGDHADIALADSSEEGEIAEGERSALASSRSCSRSSRDQSLSWATLAR